jgi:hypothetical protein
VQEAVLAAEVVMNESVIDSGALGDATHRHGTRADLAEKIGRRLDQSFLGVTAIARGLAVGT